MPASPLSTQCPNCQQVLAVTLYQLAQARGRAVCGHCQASFDALARLALNASGPASLRAAFPRSNELPLLTPAPTPAATREPLSTVQAQDPVEPTAATAPVLRHPAASVEAPPRPFVPAFARHPGRGRGRRRGLAVGAAAILLVIAAGWALHRPLARIPLTGPGMAWLCSVTGCQLPVMHDVRRLQLLARDVRANPLHPGQLAINLSVRNAAWFSQPYPTITVHLQGRQGQPLATQSFLPSQYLGNPQASQGGIKPGAELTVSLQMNDPGTLANSFTLNFQ
ncbi:zinc-ribbon and DUF3426 domain-containing protein [Frateuria aurantia]